MEAPQRAKTRLSAMTLNNHAITFSLPSETLSERKHLSTAPQKLRKPPSASPKPDHHNSSDIAKKEDLQSETSEHKPEQKDNFDKLVLEKRCEFFVQVRNPNTELSKAVTRKVKNVIYYWRGTNFCFPYCFKKYEKQMEGGVAGLNISTDLSKKKIDRNGD